MRKSYLLFLIFTLTACSKTPACNDVLVLETVADIASDQKKESVIESKENKVLDMATLNIDLAAGLLLSGAMNGPDPNTIKVDVLSINNIVEESFDSSSSQRVCNADVNFEIIFPKDSGEDKSNIMFVISPNQSAKGEFVVRVTLN